MNDIKKPLIFLSSMNFLVIDEQKLLITSLFFDSFFPILQIRVKCSKSFIIAISVEVHQSLIQKVRKM